MDNNRKNKDSAFSSIEAKHTSQKIEYIALNLIIPGEYQRATKSGQVLSIVKNFNEAKLGTLLVSLRDGKYFLIDGAHRLNALRTLGYTHALCLILEGLTREDEAEYFRTQDIDKRPLTPIDLLNAGVIAGDEKCVKIIDALKANGLQASKSHNSFQNIAAVGTLLKIYDIYGYRVLDDALRLIVRTWYGMKRATQGECLLGVAEFVSRYGMADFTERLDTKFTVVWNHYTESLRDHGMGGSVSIRKIFCRSLVEHYNRGISQKSGKRLKWIDDEIAA